ncbi:MAG: T9SS type A sorting domain-containing protein [candidate division KSB1 bacterium]|nr:T9SS type A sorting domain-containing protein [candidate division KSB1 bacterium]MDZ7364419.1 T9SS type A sorting domain-containing protein [candidate division KSB1 bacterium]MDZ7402791.1 T9SS type A sorting domain-containing protein [candidate division KSB1 bacterium]
MKMLQFVVAILFGATLAQAQTFPPPPLHKFDDGPLTPVPCAVPVGSAPTGDQLEDQLETSFSLAKMLAAPIRKWAVRYNNAPVNGDDVGYEIVADDSGYVYVAGYSYNQAGNPDCIVIKYNQNGRRLWNARYNGPANLNDVAYALAVDDSGNVYIAGYSVNSSPNRDFITIKYNRKGIRQWVASYNGPANWHDGIYDLQLDKNGNAYVTGYSYAEASGYDWVTIKYNAAGVKQWLLRHNGPGNAEDCPYEMVLDDAANLYIAGYCSTKTSGYDFMTAKYNSAGVKQWTSRYNPPANKADIANDIVLDNAGNVCVTGKSENASGDSDYLTLKYNNAGVLQWNQRYNGPGKGYDRGLDVTVDKQDNVYVTGRNWSNVSGDDWGTIKYNGAGVRQWIARYTGQDLNPDIPYKVLVDAAGEVYVNGYSYRGQFRCMDYTTIGYSNAGVKQWTVYYDGPDHLSDISYDMVLDTTGTIYITGESLGKTTGLDIATVKYVSPLSKAADGAKNFSATAGPPMAFELAQNFPNPFNPATTISFTLPTASHVRLAIYDLTGALVQILADGEMSAGQHHLNVDASRLASGVYFYRIEAGTYSATRKMILQK